MTHAAEEKHELSFRRVVRLIEGTSDKKGLLLLEPDIELEDWLAALSFPAEKIIALYQDQGAGKPGKSICRARTPRTFKSKGEFVGTVTL